MEGDAKHAWKSGQLRLVPVGPFRTRDVSLSISHRFPEGISLDVVIRRTSGRPAHVQMGLKRHGRDRWLVDWWDIRWGPHSALCDR